MKHPSIGLNIIWQILQKLIKSHLKILNFAFLDKTFSTVLKLLYYIHIFGPSTGGTLLSAVKGSRHLTLSVRGPSLDVRI